MQKKAVVVLGLLALGIGLPAVAQDVAILRQNQFELGGFGGFSYGVDHSRVMGGGNVTYSALSWLLPYAEFNYFPSIQRTAVGAVGGTNFKDVYDIPMDDVNFGVHVRVRLPHTRIVPYIVAGAGLLHLPQRQQQRYDANYPLTNPPTYETTAQNPPPTPFPASTNFAANFGGGFRYYLSEQFGLRVETKGYRLTSPPGGASPFQSSPWIYRATFGVFVQFGR